MEIYNDLSHNSMAAATRSRIDRSFSMLYKRNKTARSRISILSPILSTLPFFAARHEFPPKRNMFQPHCEIYVIIDHRANTDVQFCYVWQCSLLHLTWSIIVKELCSTRKMFSLTTDFFSRIWNYEFFLELNYWKKVLTTLSVKTWRCTSVDKW